MPLPKGHYGSDQDDGDCRTHDGPSHGSEPFQPQLIRKANEEAAVEETKLCRLVSIHRMKPLWKSRPPTRRQWKNSIDRIGKSSSSSTAAS